MSITAFLLRDGFFRLLELDWYVNHPVLQVMAGLIFLGLMFWLVLRLWLRRFLPRRRGTVAVDGIHSQVTIRRDDYGVPTIEGSSLVDVLFGQGFAQAQDRLWQMELNRRLGEGRLAEIVGKEALRADIFLRKLGLRTAARSDLEALTEKEREHLDAFCAGVNAGINSLKVLPVEFQLLKFSPQPWTPEDTLAWIQVMSMDLCANWEQELTRGEMLEKVSPEVAELLHLYQREGACTVPPGESSKLVLDGLRELFQEARGFLPNSGLPGGSNAWVVSGSRTRSGKPLLASDPHLVGRVPSIWYESRLVSPELDVRGASFPGVPFIVIGSSPKVGWGVTNSYADTQDLYMERFSPDDPALYQTENGWERVSVRRERIVVRGAEDHVEEVECTRHGPILFRSKSLGLALCWMNFEPSHPVQTLYQMNSATNCSQFKEALRTWQAPSSNFVFADADGNIGYIMAGQVPMRKKGTGLTPVPGWSGEYEWDGVIPFEELPQADNPACGYIVTANNPVVGPEYPYHLTWDWMSSTRAERIEELLLSQPQFEVEDFVSMQVDVHCATGLRFARLCGHHKFSREDAEKGQIWLSEWDGSGHPESGGMALYQVALLGVAKEVAHTVLGERLGSSLLGGSRNPFSTLGGHGGRYTVWVLQLFENDAAYTRLQQLVPSLRDRAEILEEHLGEAFNQLSKAYGRNPKYWEWGKLHRIQFKHALGSQPLLGMLLNSPTGSAGGDADTVFQTIVNPALPFEANAWCPSFRQVVEMTDPQEYRSVLPTGQSGHPGSRNYMDQFHLWCSGQTRKYDVGQASLLTLQVRRH